MSFRKYGGINHAAKNNIVKSHYSTSDNQTISNTLGQTNTKIVSKSHLDMDEHSLLNLRSVYFMDGTVQYTAYPGLANGDLEVKGNLIVDGSTTLFGNATAPTLSIGNNSTHIATTSFVQSAINQIAFNYATKFDVTTDISNAILNIHLPNYAKLNADVSFNSIQFKTGAVQNEPLLPTINILPTSKNQSTFVPPSDNNWIEYQYPSNIKINKFGQIISIQDTAIKSSDETYNGWTLSDTLQVIGTRSNLLIGSDIIIDPNMAVSISTSHTYATLFHLNVLNLKIGGSTLFINMGSNSTITTINGSELIVPGKISTTTTGSSYLFDTTTTTLNIGGEATNINIGAPNGNTLLRTSLDVSGNTKLYGSLNVQSDASFNTININNGNFNVDISGNIRTHGSLNVQSDASFGTINLNNGNFNVDISGNIRTHGSLNVQSDASFGTINLNNGNFKVDISGNTVTQGSLNVQGDASFNTINLNNGNFKVDISGNTKVEGTLTVTNDLIIIGKINHTDATVNSINLLITDKTITLNKNGDSDSSDNGITYNSAGCGFYFEEKISSDIGFNIEAGSLLINSDRNDFEVVLPGSNWTSLNGPRKMLLHRSGFTTQIDGLLDVSGNTKIKSSLNVQCDASFGTINLNNGNFNVDISGNTNMNGKLNVTNDATITGRLDVSGNTKIKSSLNVQSDASFGTINLNSGNFNVDISGNTTMNGKLNVTNNATITGILDVSGNTKIRSSLNVQNDASFGTINLNNGNFNVDILGNTNTNGNLWVKKDALIDGSLNVTTGIISTIQTGIATLFDTNATTLKIGGQATAITMGSTIDQSTLTINNQNIVGLKTTQNLFNNSTTTTLNIGGSADIYMGGSGGDNKVTIYSPNVVGIRETQYLFDTIQTKNLNIGGASIAVNIGSASGTLNVCNRKFIFSSDGSMNLNSGKFIFSADGAMNLNSGKFTVDSTGNTSLNGPFNVSNGIISTAQSGTATLFDTNATTLKIGGQSTYITMGSSQAQSTLTINNQTVVGFQPTQNLFNTVATTLNIGGVATNITMGSTQAQSTLIINNQNIVGFQPTQNLFNTGTTILNIGGAASTVNIGSASGTLNVYQNKFIVSSDGSMNLNNGKFTVDNTGNTSLNGPFNVSNGIISTAQSGTATLFDTNATTLKIGGQSTYITMGSSQAQSTLTINNQTVVGFQPTQNLFNTVATTLNIGGVATNITMGSTQAQSTLIINNQNIVGFQPTQNLFNTGTTILNIGGAASTVNIGSLINNSTIIKTGELNVSTGTISTSNTGTAILFDTSSTALRIGGAATNITMGHTTGSLTINNPTVIGSNLTQNLFNTVATTLNIGGEATNITIGSDTSTSRVNLCKSKYTFSSDGTMNLNNKLRIDSAGTLYISNDFTIDSVGNTKISNNCTLNFTKLSIGGSITPGIIHVDSVGAISSSKIVMNDIDTATQAELFSSIVNKFPSSTPTFTTVTASTFIGDLSGNAKTATKLNKTLIIDGIEFDGSRDISFNTKFSLDPSFSTVIANTITANTKFIGDLSGNAKNAGIIGCNIGKLIYNTAIGNNTLTSNTYKEDEIPSGDSGTKTMYNGAFNTALGNNALSKNTTGSYNIALGDSALSPNTTGTFNTAIGNLALNGITNGTYNTAIGYKADISGSNISNSIAIGSKAIVYESNTIQLGNVDIEYVKTYGRISTTGDISGNIFYGTNFTGNGVITNFGSFNYIGVGVENINPKRFSVDTSGIVTAPKFIGDLSGNAKTASKLNKSLTINGNKFDGIDDVSFNITSSSDTTVNLDPSFNTVRASITFIGDLSGNATNAGIKGNNNTAIGYQSLINITTGSNNTAIGYKADVSGNNLTNAIAIGANAIVDASNTIQLGNSSIKNVKTSGIITSLLGLKISDAITMVPDGAITTVGIITANSFIGDISGGAVRTNNGYFNNIQVGSNTTTRQFSVDESGNVIATKFIGDLSGNAATATKVLHKLTIYGNGIATKEFDGSQDISFNITSGTSSGTTTTNAGILPGFNTAIGDRALSKNMYDSEINEITQRISTTGIGNVAIGSQSLINNTTGSFNTAIGCMAVNDASFNGNKNTTIGAFSDISGNIENSTAIGANAIVTTSNTIQLGDSNITNVNTDGDIYTTGNINATTFNGSHFQGIGTDSSVITSVGIFNSYITTPQISVSGDASFNKIYGGKNGEFKVDTSGNVTAPKFIGDLSGNSTTANYATSAGTAGACSGTANYATSAGTAVACSGTANYATSAGTAGTATSAGTANYATSAGTAGTATSAETATSAGTASKVSNAITFNSVNSYNGSSTVNVVFPAWNTNFTFYDLTANSFNATSDYRVKENVQQLDTTLFNVDKLIPVTYNKIDSGKQDIGFIAHEVQEVFPFLVTGEKDGEQTQSLNYLGLIGVLVKEIQELKKRVAILENK